MLKEHYFKETDKVALCPQAEIFIHRIILARISEGLIKGDEKEAEHWTITESRDQRLQRTVKVGYSKCLCYSWIILTPCWHNETYISPGSDFQAKCFGNYGQTMRLCTDLVKKRVGLKYIRNAKKMRILSAGNIWSNWYSTHTALVSCSRNWHRSATQH